MEFSIIWSDKAIDQLAKLERPIGKRIFNKVGKLKQNPHRYVTRQVGSKSYKLRVGDYRVLLDIDGNQLSIDVVEVGPRKNIYKKK